MAHADTSELTALIPSLMRRAQRLTRNRTEAEDLVQDTLLRLCISLRNGVEIEDLRAYAMRALRNAAQRQWQRVQTEEFEEDMATTAPDALRRLDCADTLAAIDKLPAPQKRLMEYVLQGETSPARIAKRTGLPVGTVMSRLARARSRLRADLRSDPETTE